jgi:predicted DCC family thiol-disulfide oxidoreductase YuxK
MPGQLIYDGDCGFCRKCVARWKTITGGRAQAVPYQEAAAEHPEIPIEEFRRAVQYIDENGLRFSGAPAIFESLKDVPGYGWLAWSYRHVPLFAPASDWVYREVAGHRKSATRLTRMLWGASGAYFAAPEYKTAVWLFTRLLAIIFMIAFISFGVQARGLIGSQGILPVASYLEAVRNSVGSQAWVDAPTIFWWWHSDGALEFTCRAGAALALICALGLFQRALFAAIFIMYLSLVTAGQVFMGYQWDFLLLECAFLAIFLTPSLPRVWLCQWLLFRLMFESGCVKLLSHDPVWANLTAISYHYQTQPLPTPLAWYAFQAPMWFHKMSTAAVFAVELLAPFLIFGPRRIKQFAALAFISLQLLIMLTGNYTCFNLLAMSLCLFLLDDQFWGRFGEKLRRGTRGPDPMRSRLLSAALVAFVLVASGVEIATMFSESVPAAGQSLVSGLAPFGVVNSYGLFASMTTVRMEIEVQGSNDGNTWETYTFRYKPGDPARAPRWVAPHQPRLDWQMWFAALGNYRENPWFSAFMYRLLSASPDVLGLLEKDPFAGHRPKYVRALAFEYRFSDIHYKDTAQLWWRREPKGMYFPPSSLRNP